MTWTQILGGKSNVSRAAIKINIKIREDIAREPNFAFLKFKTILGSCNCII